MVAWTPALLHSVPAITTAVSVWHQILSERASMAPALMVDIRAAWQWSIDARVGFFASTAALFMRSATVLYPSRSLRLWPCR